MVLSPGRGIFSVVNEAFVLRLGILKNDGVAWVGRFGWMVMDTCIAKHL